MFLDIKDIINPMKLAPSWGFGVHMTFYHVLPVYSIAYCIDFAIIINHGNKMVTNAFFELFHTKSIHFNI